MKTTCVSLTDLSVAEQTATIGGEFVVPIAIGGAINPETGKPIAVLYASEIQLPIHKTIGWGR